MWLGRSGCWPVMSQDEAVFPRTYRLDERNRHGGNFLCIALTSLLIFFDVVAARSSSYDADSLPPLLFMNVGMAALILFIGSGVNKRVLLYADAIEVRGWFRSHKLYFRDIRGWRTNAGSSSVYEYAYIFVPADEDKPKLAVPGGIPKDQFFRDWIKTIPKVPPR